MLTLLDIAYLVDLILLALVISDYYTDLKKERVAHKQANRLP